MASDPSYQVTPPPPRVPAEREETSPLVPVDLQLSPSIWWTGGQLAFVAFEAMAVLAVVVGVYVLQPDYVALLWQHPTGIKMLVVSVLLLVVNFAGFLGLCLWFNHRMPPGDETKQGRRTIAHWLFALLFLVFLYLPVMFVILVGPAAIAIQESLMK